jgi:hypothetical protein
MGFSCPSDSDPYLVRSLQWNRSLSGYTIGLRDSALQVSHGSLGRSASISRAPLIVCLSTKPPQVFVEAYAAQ